MSARNIEQRVTEVPMIGNDGIAYNPSGFIYKIGKEPRIMLYLSTGAYDISWRTNLLPEELPQFLEQAVPTMKKILLEQAAKLSIDGAELKGSYFYEGGLNLRPECYGPVKNPGDLELLINLATIPVRKQQMDGDGEQMKLTDMSLTANLETPEGKRHDYAFFTNNKQVEPEIGMNLSSSSPLDSSLKSLWQASLPERSYLRTRTLNRLYNLVARRVNPHFEAIQAQTDRLYPQTS